MRGRWLLLPLVACGGAGQGSPERPATSLTILAAASLTDVFSDLEGVFEAGHPGVEVQISFAGSQTLASQIRQGIAADVFASADALQIRPLVEEGLVEEPRPFAQNALVLALSDSAPPGVDLEHLPLVDSLVVGDEQVPVGRYTAAMLDAAQLRYGAEWRRRVEAAVVSREPNARLILTKVALGEATTAVVYATEVASAAGVRAVALPTDLAPLTTCFHARLAGAGAPALAAEWMALVESTKGRTALRARGFQVDGP